MKTPVLVWSQVLLVLIDFVLKFGRFFTKFTRVYMYILCILNLLTKTKDLTFEL